MSLCTKFEVDPPPSVADAMHQELASVMAPAGIHFEWRSLTGWTGNERAISIAVIMFKGRCDAERMPVKLQRRGVLGVTHISDGAVIPFSDIDCDQIHELIRDDLGPLNGDLRERLFGRAIARVLAHELYHILAKTNKHGASGIARSSFTAQELLSDVFGFGKKELAAMRTGEIAMCLANPLNVHRRDQVAAERSAGPDQRRADVGGERGVRMPQRIEK